MSLPTLIGLAGISLLLSAALLRILLFFKVKKQTAWIICAIGFALTYLAISGYSLNQYFRGLFNDLSITSIILLSYYIFRPETGKQQSLPVLVLMAIAGLLFYPAALGFGPIDPYAWGYIYKGHDLLAPSLLLIMIAALMVYAYSKQHTLLLLCLVLSTLAYQINLLESRNLWDYLLDPLICFYALIGIFIRKIINIPLNERKI